MWKSAACPKVNLNAETKFHASVGVITGLCAGKFGVRVLVGTRGYFSSPKRSEWPWGILNTHTMGSGRFFPGGGRGGEGGGGKEVG